MGKPSPMPVKMNKIIAGLRHASFEDSSDKVTKPISKETRRIIKEFVFDPRLKSHNPVLQLAVELSAIYCSVDFKRQNYLARIIRYL